jgi:hypothetical protein
METEQVLAGGMIIWGVAALIALLLGPIYWKRLDDEVSRRQERERLEYNRRVSAGEIKGIIWPEPPKPQEITRG